VAPMISAPVATAAVLALLTLTSAARAQQTIPATTWDTVIAGAHYRAGWLHRLLLGAHYRDLWATPIEVPVLDLSRFAGGLTPNRCGGRRQTKSLRLLGADGRQYVFRSVDKDPTLALPPELRRTFARQLIQDQISSAHPGSPLVVAPLLDAVGVLQASPQIAVLPDDPRLRPYECVRPGMLGMIEERPTEPPDNDVGFAGAKELADTRELFAKLEDDANNRIDARDFLAARLMDVFIGDWDRHQDQWRWARFDSGSIHWWRPIPRDRDQAFARLDGFLIWLAGFYQPQLIGFDDEYPNLWRLTFTGQGLDRRLLVGLERATWDSVAAVLRTRLTDSVIDAAVHNLPVAYYDRSGATLRHALQLRRDHLPEMTSRYYELLAEVVEVHGTDQNDFAEVIRHGDGRMTVRLTDVRATAAARAPYYRRTFQRAETKEVRLYLHGGDDKLIVRDSAARGTGPLLRVIGGANDDELADSSRYGRTRFYDDRGTNRFIRAPGTVVDRHPYEPPPIDTVTLRRPRDWGSRTMPILWSGYAPDLGFFIGGGLTRTGYGFRKLPYSSWLRLRAGYATAAQAFRVEFESDSRDALGGADLSVRARASGIDILHFYGFGNETADTGAKDFYKVRQQQYIVAPLVGLQGGGPASLFVGPIFKYAHTDLEQPSLVQATLPYGVPDFAQLGAGAELTFDTRDRPPAASRGVALRLGGRFYPRALDVTEAFGTAHAEAATYLSARLPLKPTVALRVAGEKVWGPYPFHEAAFIGGWNTVRGFPEQRFAGDASLYGNLELRVSVRHFFVVVPGELGLFALGDAGRVFVRGEQSERWHSAIGGGLSLAFLSPTNTVSLAAADGGEGLRMYARAGFAF